MTAADSYPCPNISDIMSSLGKSTFFSTLDASLAYNVIPVSPESRPITTFATMFGLFQFARMPFGLKNAGAAYCRLVQRMIDMLSVEGVLAYLDDLLIHSVYLNLPEEGCLQSFLSLLRERALCALY